MSDPILDDLHATRERLLAESGGTLKGLVARLEKEQAASGRQLWKPRRAKDHAEAEQEPRSADEPVSSAQ